MPMFNNRQQRNPTGKALLEQDSDSACWDNFVHRFRSRVPEASTPQHTRLGGNK